MKYITFINDFNFDTLKESTRLSVFASHMQKSDFNFECIDWYYN